MPLEWIAPPSSTSRSMSTTSPLPIWFPDHQLEIDPARSSPGYTLVETSPAARSDDAPAQVLVAYDDAGEVVWYYTNTGAIGGWCGTTLGLFDTGFEHVDVSNTQNRDALVAEAAFTNHLVAASFLDNPVGRLLQLLLPMEGSRGSAKVTRPDVQHPVAWP